jgi:methanogenic corrinoid protein MtbC1
MPTHPPTIDYTAASDQLARMATPLTRMTVDRYCYLYPQEAPDVLMPVCHDLMLALATALGRKQRGTFTAAVETGAEAYQRHDLPVPHLVTLLELAGEAVRAELAPPVWEAVRTELDPAIRWLHRQTEAADTANLSVDGVSQAYLAALLRGDRFSAHALIWDLVDRGTRLRDIYLRIFQPVLYQIGQLWEQGQVSVAQEHLATAITQYVLSAIYARFGLGITSDKNAIVACLAGNYHEVGPRMVADFLQMAGYNTRFLGANTPQDDLLTMIDSIKPDVIGLPSTTVQQVQAVRDAIIRVKADFLRYRPVIMVGGLAFNATDGLWQDVGADLWRVDAGLAVDELVGSTGWAQ